MDLSPQTILRGSVGRTSVQQKYICNANQIQGKPLNFKGLNGLVAPSKKFFIKSKVSKLTAGNSFSINSTLDTW